jgi:hypothetical protein
MPKQPRKPTRRELDPKGKDSIWALRLVAGRARLAIDWFASWRDAKRGVNKIKVRNLTHTHQFQSEVMIYISGERVMELLAAKDRRIAELEAKIGC